MYFQYYPVGESTVKKESVTDLEIASYIATEWFPNVPYSVINGFAEVIGNVLMPIRKGSSTFWHVNPDLAITDRQWKGMTSWIVGVAFTRFVIESEGYPWWSPVSAFKGDRSRGLTTTGNWLPSIPRTNFRASPKPKVVTVRAWNSTSSSASENDLQFAHFLANHYAGMCSRLGLLELAILIETVGTDMVRQFAPHNSKPELFDQIHLPPLTSIHSLLERFDQLTAQAGFRSREHAPDILAFDTPRSVIPLGGQIFNATLTSAALNIMRTLVSQDIPTTREVVQSELQHIQAMSSQYDVESGARIRILPNGIAIARQG